MSVKCPKCGRTVSPEATYCPHCGQGLKPNATTFYTRIAVALIIVATAGSLIFFILSVSALEGVYSWYPQFVAQQWFVYDQLFMAFTFSELMFGAMTTVFILSKRSPKGALASAMFSTLSGAGVFIVSLVQPLPVLWESILFYFIPLFAAPLTGNLLIYLRKEELESPSRNNA
jgi:hypothetical protein